MIVSIIIITVISIIAPLLIYFTIETSSSIDSKVQQIEEKSKEIENHFSESKYGITRRQVDTISALGDLLKPCPVCGGRPRVEKVTDYAYVLGKQIRYSAGCPNHCGQVLTFLDMHNLVKSWNKYADDMMSETIKTAKMYIGINGNAVPVSKVTVMGATTSTKPKSTNCPNCGAPVDIHAEKCAYCDTPYI